MPTPDTAREIKPYIPPWGEIRNRWVSTGDDTYTSPYLAVEENGDGPLTETAYRGDEFYLADAASSRSGIPLCVASCQEMLQTVMKSDAAAQQAMQYVEESRNAMNGIRLGSGKNGILLISRTPSITGVTLLEKEFEEFRYIEGFDDATGAPNATTSTRRGVFENAMIAGASILPEFYKYVYPVARLKICDGRCFYVGPGGVLDPNKGFRFTAYEKNAFEKMTRGLANLNTTLLGNLERRGFSRRDFAAWMQGINAKEQVMKIKDVDERHMVAPPKAYGRLSRNQQLRVHYFVGDATDMLTLDRRKELYAAIRASEWHEDGFTDTQTYAFFDDITLMLRRGTAPSREAVRGMLKK